MPRTRASKSSRPWAIGTTALAIFGCGRTPVVHGVGRDDDGLGELPMASCGDDPLHVFATMVLQFDPTASGGRWPEREDVIDPRAALGPPDYQPASDDVPDRPLGTVSIGDGGLLAVGFEPCGFMADGARGSADLYVHEAGFDERVTISVRPIPQMRGRIDAGSVVDDEGFVSVTVDMDDEGGFDLDAGVRVTGGPPVVYDALRIRDVPGQGLETVLTPGADIDAFEVVEVVDLG